MGHQVTHEIIYVNKEGDVRTARALGQEETDDLMTILDRNNALYTVEDLRGGQGHVSVPSNQEA